VRYDYAIFGAGVWGAWLARTLHRSGKKVLLVDQHGPANNRASSGGETRIIRMGYGTKAIYTEWSLRALRLYKEFYAKTDPTLFHNTGMLWMCRDNDEFARQSIHVFKKQDVRHEVLTRGELDKRYPQVDFGACTWGLYEHDAGGLLARRGVQTVVRETVREGLTYEQAFVAPPGKHEYDAGTYVYACGPWLKKLFPEVLGNKINPTRQEVFYFGTSPGDMAFRIPRMPCWVDGGDSVYGLPDIENRGFKLAIDAHGPTVDPDTQDRAPTKAVIDHARAYIAKRFPSLKDAPLTQSEVCQYENTANGDYVIDKHPGHANVWLLGGGSGHGYKHGPALAEYVAAALEGKGRIDPMFSLAAKADVSAAQRNATIPQK